MVLRHGGEAGKGTQTLGAGVSPSFPGHHHEHPAPICNHCSKLTCTMYKSQTTSFNPSAKQGLTMLALGEKNTFFIWVMGFHGPADTRLCLHGQPAPFQLSS